MKKTIFLFTLIFIGFQVKAQKIVKKPENFEVDIVRFQEFHPEASAKKVKIKNDAAVCAYLTESYTMDDLTHAVSSSWFEDINKESREVNIRNQRDFRKAVRAEAESLGYLRKDLKDLSVHEAVFLPGKIVASRMEYYNQMLTSGDERIHEYTHEVLAEAVVEELLADSSVGRASMEKEKTELYQKVIGKIHTDSLLKKMCDSLMNDSEWRAQVQVGLLISDAFEKKDRRNSEAKRIDRSEEDRIFFEGLGVCRNYAAVNIAVFGILKKINRSLRNTYLKWYKPQGLAESILLPHAWNQVVTLSEQGDQLKVLMTFVDPTWLDTRKQSADNSGEKTEISEEAIYNALDENHFFTGSLSAYTALAELYEFLGNASRRDSWVIAMNTRGKGRGDFAASFEVCSFYRKKVFEKRLLVCKKAIQAAQAGGDTSSAKRYFKESFADAVRAMTGQVMGVSDLGFPVAIDWNTVYIEKDEKLFGKLKKVFEEAEKVFLLSREKVEVEFWGEEEEELKEISFPELIKALEEKFYEDE